VETLVPGTAKITWRSKYCLLVHFATLSSSTARYCSH